jgi:hypothetical protein
LQRQLAESKLRTARLQATIKETCNTLAFTDLDYKHLIAAMQQQQSKDQFTDCSFATALLELTY